MSKPGASDSLSSLWLLLKRLVMPSLFFLFFLGFLISHDDLIEKFTGNVSEVVMVSVRYGSQIGLWLSATFLVQRLITVFVWDGLIAGISGRPVPSLPKDVTAMILFGFAVMGVLATVFDKSVTGIWATSGILGIVVGIALRNVILDVFIGLSMHLEQSFRIGDWVMIHQNRRETHIIGQVIEINWRTTRLKTTEKNMIVVPNSKMGEAILTNYMRPKPHFRIDLEFVLDYSVRPNRAIRVLTGAVKSLVDDIRILSDPGPEVRLDQALANGQRYEVRFFILPTGMSPKESRHLVNRRVIEHLSESGLTPSMDKERVFLEKGSSLPLLGSHNDENLARAIERSPLSKPLNNNEYNDLRASFYRKDLKAGETLYRQGNRGSTMFLLVEGLLSSLCTIKGFEGEAKVEHVEPGRHFGEECVLGKNSRSSTMTANTDCVLLCIEDEAIRRIAQSNAQFFRSLNTEMGLSQDKIIKSKWNIKREKDKSSKASQKKRKSGVFQTFFTDLFPQSASEEPKS